MTKTQNIITLSAVAIVASLLALPMLTSGAEASTASRLMNCASNNKGKTIDCCESVVRGAVPLWMKTTGRNCEVAVQCGGYNTSFAANFRRCRVVIWQGEGPNDRTKRVPQRNDRTLNRSFN